MESKLQVTSTTSSSSSSMMVLRSSSNSSVIPELSEMVLAEQQESLLKRRSSWKKFKDTVVGWVSGAPPSPPVDLPPLPDISINVPSPVQTPADVIFKTSENINNSRKSNSIAINNSNPPKSTPSSSINSQAKLDKVKKNSTNSQIHTDKKEDENNLPKIVITYEEKSPFQVRKISKPVEDDKNSKSDENMDDDDEDMKKQIAVAKIKQAIFGMNHFDSTLSGSAPINTPASLDPERNMTQRRHSDISGLNSSPTPPVTPTRKEAPPFPPVSRTSSKRRSSAAVGGSNSLLNNSSSSGNTTPVKGLSRSNSAKVPSNKPKPMIWDHFDPVPNNNSVGKCKTCKMTVSCKYNTGQFVRHLQLTHKDVYRMYQSKMDSQWTRSVIEKNLK